jgi:adhesin transport system membrane fusion protein
MKREGRESRDVNHFHGKKRSDVDYLHNYHAALFSDGGKYTRWIIWGVTLFFIVLITWFYFAKIDKMTRGTGKVVPSLELQYIQSFDGGIISEIFVHEGDSVKVGAPVVRIDDTDFKSKYLGNKADINALTAQIARLTAESQGRTFVIPEIPDRSLYQKFIEEKKLYDAKQTTLSKKIEILKEKAIQKESELTTLQVEIENLKQSLVLAEESLDISRRMLKHKVVSKMQYNDQLKQMHQIEGDLKTKQSLLPKVASEIKSTKQEIAHAKLSFQSESRAELEKVTAEFEKLNEAKNIDKGRINRALITSPINGTIKKMHYNTLGGVVKPGGVIAEVVPTEEHLIIDTKILPSKIAFIYTGQKAVVRFSAYDFAKYGSLDGEVISISADTTIDEIDKKHYYTVKVKTTKNYLEKDGEHLPIKIGMVATVDIMNGKQSILDYILNPIITAKQNMLSSN